MMPRVCSLVMTWPWVISGGREDRQLSGLAVVDPFDHAALVAAVGELVQLLFR